MRTFFVAVDLDDNCITDENLAPADYLECEFGWLNDSGIYLNEFVFAEADSDYKWERYINYLSNWIFNNSDRGDDPCSPLTYQEWLNTSM